MIINKIVITNFKQYYGEQEVVLSRPGIQNVTIINGKNGAGKTNFFTAINWCLYGENEVEIEGQIVNKNALKETIRQSVVSAKVALYFTHSGSSFLLKRVYEVRKNSPDEFSPLGPSNVYMYELGRDGQKQRMIQDPSTRLNTILPSNVRTYFLFDGERIDEFARPDHEKEVWDAVKNVLKLEVIERGRKHLGDIAKDYSQELRNLSSGNLSILLEQEDELKTKKEKLQEDLDLDKTEIKECDRQISLIEEKQSKIAEIKELIQRRDNLRKEIKGCELQLSESKKILKGDISRVGLIFGEKALVAAEGLLTSRVQEDQIPPGVLKKLCQKIIDEGSCICGREIKRNSPEFRILLDTISQEGQEKDNQRDLIELKALIKASKQYKKDLVTNIRYQYSQSRQFELKIETLYVQENEISGQLTDSETENVSKLEESRKQLLTDKGILIGRINSASKQIEQISEKIEEVQKKIEQEKTAQKEMDLLRRRMLLTERTAAALEDIYTRFAKEMRNKIEEKASEVFQKLIRKKQSFIKVTLSEDYQLRLIDRFGDEDSRNEISAGERQVLSLAFILGLARVSEEEAPLIMDTPFGRLDSEHRRNIVATIPALTSQLVLFVTDEELDEENRNILQSNIEREYTLEFDDFTGNTRIVKEL